MQENTPAQKSRKYSVLLVDDSSVIRGILRKIIEIDPDIEVVGAVSNGEQAISTANKHKPDVIILDIEMPVMDGLTALPEITKVSPDSKVIMFSALTAKGADATLKAFSLGAVECIVKPSSNQEVGPGSEFQKNLVGIIRNLVDAGAPSEAPRTERPAPSAAGTSAILSAATDNSFKLHNDSMSYKGKPSLLAIGSSTGGPQALLKVIAHFKNFDIPIIITQHMPATFTKILAEHIQQHTGVTAHEGAEGMKLEKGCAYVAPGGYHMEIVKTDSDLTIALNQKPPINFCRPSVDPMFKSVVDIFGNKVLGVILTGMGNDGIGGGQALVKAGGRLIAQDEATSVVWGMPRAVAKAGICSAVLPLDEIGPWVRKAVLG